jgi:CHAD domain-containing protein
MNRDKIRELVVEKSGELSKTAARIGNGFEREDIHDFRVTFKFLRAFLRLLRMHDPNNGLRPSDKLKDLYQIAGSIRDLQLELAYTKEHHPDLGNYVQELQDAILTYEKTWKRTYSPKTLDKFIRQVEHHNYEDLPEGILANFLNSKLLAIDEQSAIPNPTDEQVHNIRKDAKDILYTTHAVKEKWHSAQGSLKVVPVKKLDKVASRIGDYNDTRNHLAHIGDYSQTLAETPEKANIDRIAKAKKSSMAKEKNNILKMVRKLFSGKDEGAPLNK